MKAGGAYLPLDPAAPLKRLETILQDAKCPILITQKTKLNSLQAIPDRLQTICIDDGLDLSYFPDEITYKTEVTSEHIAYVMYTSGSTGKPKGVCVIHRGIIRLVKNTNYVNLSTDEVILQLASIAFDAATFEIWASLLNGGKLVLMPVQTPSLQEIGAAIKQYGITTLWLTSGLFNLVVEEHIEYLKPLKQLLAGGDILSRFHVKKVLKEIPHCQLINGYGPTENTTFTCCHHITIDDLVKPSIPIGRPIANTQVYVLDNDLQLVPIGVAGELYIGGDGLAKGYLNQPHLTTEKFIKNPFSHDPNSHLYKTGDRVRWCEDGTLEFLGRIDFQVKIRGYRVELGEIETILSHHHQVKSTAVLAIEDSIKNKQLVAYVIPEEKITDRQLRDFLKDKLPDYMIPSEFIFLEEFPLNLNGKVDRQKLINYRLQFKQNYNNNIAPKTPTETHLVNIYEAVLGKPVNINDSFIQLGGNSLQAIKIISRIRDMLKVNLPVEAILKDIPLTELATSLETSHQKENYINWSTLSLTSISKQKDYPLSLYQERMWLIIQKAEKNPVYNLPIIFQLQGSVNTSILEQAINQLIQRHESLRTFFPIIDGFPVQRILSSFSVVLYLEFLSETEAESQINQRIQTEITRPFQLTQTPPIRCLLLQLSKDKFIFIMVIHHLIADGWSLNLILQELSSLYNNLINNHPTGLPPVPLQYKDFSIQHRKWLENPQTYHPLVNYWTEQLKDAPSITSLPTDYPRPPLQTFEGAIEKFNINAEFTQKLKDLSQETQSTLYMILLSAFLILLSRYNEQEDLVIGVPIANRNRTEIESTIGCFSTVIPFRIRFSKNSSFLDFLKSIKEVFLEAYIYQEFPIEQMLKQLVNRRNLSYSPWFQIIFNFLNIPHYDLDLSGIKPTHLLRGKPSTLSDLMVLFWETSTGIKGFFEYNTHLFSKSKIAQLINEFKQLLKDIIDDPNLTIEQITLLTQDEQSLNLKQDNKTQTIFPHQSNVEIEKTYIAPRTVTEKTVTKIWRELLGIDKVGVKDNFFELGGHSLLAMRMLAKISQEFNRDFSLVNFLHHPTIESLIEQIQEPKNLGQESSVVPIQTQGENPPLFFINSISHAQNFGKYLNKNQPFYILNIFGITEFLTPKINLLKLEDVATKFVEDLQTVQPHGPYFLLTYCGDSYLAVEMAQQLQLKGEKVALLGFIDSFWDSQDLGVSLHFSNFRKFGFNYVVEKLRNRFCTFKERLIVRLKQKYSYLYSFNYQPAPRYLEDVKLLQAFEFARIHYVPKPYAGKINLFLSQEYSLLDCSKLKTLAKEGVDIQEIPGYHHTLFEDPYVQILAQKVESIITPLNPCS